MIEDGMFLALGFCVATLIALACIPILWARAMRLTRQRLERLVPLSPEEIDAERDGIRAEAAVAHRRLEQAAEKARQAAARVTIELGRRTVDLAMAERIGAELAADKQALTEELTALSRDLRDGEGQRGALEKGLHDADSRIESLLAEAREQVRRFDDLLAVSEERRGSIASLETRNAGLKARLEDREDDLTRLREKEAALTAAQATLTGERDAARNEILLAAAERTKLEQSLAEQAARAEKQKRRLAARSESLVEADKHMAEQDMAIRSLEGALATLQRRFDDLQASVAQKPLDADEVATIRSAIVLAGDEALQLLHPPAEEPPNHEAASPINQDAAVLLPEEQR